MLEVRIFHLALSFYGLEDGNSRLRVARMGLEIDVYRSVRPKSYDSHSVKNVFQGRTVRRQCWARTPVRPSNLGTRQTSQD